MIKKVLNLRPVVERKLGKTQPVFKYFNRDMFLVRSGKERPENTICFTSGLDMTKPEIRQLLEKLYQLDVKKVNTWNKQGKIQRMNNGKYARRKDIKRIIVELNTTVPSELQTIV